MLGQITMGSMMLVLCVGVAGAAMWLIEHMTPRLGPWLAVRPHRPRLVLAVMAACLMVMALVTLAVWLWALMYLSLGIFSTLENALYFSITAFTTLGFGDMLAPDEWRILAAMEAANGMLYFGFLTAIIVEAMRSTRQHQQQAEEDE